MKAVLVKEVGTVQGLFKVFLCEINNSIEFDVFYKVFIPNGCSRQFRSLKSAEKFISESAT